MKYLRLGHNGIEVTIDMENNLDEYFRREYKTMETRRQHYSSIKKNKRFRSAFTTDQVNYLEKEFKKFPYIGNGQRKEIATALSISERAVKIWFQNRRMKEKKDTNNKDFDDDELYSIRAVEFGKDQLNTEQSSNDQRPHSLPVLTLPVVTMSEPNNEYGGKTINEVYKPIITRVQSKCFNEAVCNQKKTVAPTPMQPFKKKRSSSHYKKSPEFSTDLSKHYKGQSEKVMTFDKETKRNDSKSKKSSSSRHQTSPEDLSSSKIPKLSQSQHKVGSGNIKVNNPGYIPVLPTIYAHPYISPGGMVWKPININPVMSSDVSAPALSSNHTRLSAAQEQRKKCSCNCHEQSHPAPMTFQQNPHAKYIITTVPFQNASPKF